MTVQGSVERALAQLDAYCNNIEQRVCAHFDRARTMQDLDAMAACTAIMSHFQRDPTKLAVRFRLIKSYPCPITICSACIIGAMTSSIHAS